MGKATRIRQENARAKIAAQRAAARKSEIRKRVYLATGSIVAVVAIVIAFIVIKANSHPPTGRTAANAPGGAALPASVMEDLTSVPVSTLNTVGGGSVTAATKGKPATDIKGPALMSNSKPEMLYIGAEFCPYCAAMRWSMAVALSRFGTLSNVHGTYSDSADTDPSTPTLTFYKSSYSSQYLSFVSVENATVTKAPLQPTTKAQDALWAKYDPSGKGYYPFIDIDNKYYFGVVYDPGVLAKMSWAQIASTIKSDPSSPVTQGAVGAANYLTAALCNVTHDLPASACGIPGVKSLEGKV